MYVIRNLCTVLSIGYIDESEYYINVDVANGRCMSGAYEYVVVFIFFSAVRSTGKKFWT